MDAGNLLGHFALLEKIGEGGMGRVYKARDTSLERLVAVKLLPENRLADPDRRARFIHEAKAASALNHPNIITIHEVGEQDGQTFIVMELIDGKPLNELIPRKGMRLNETLRIAAQVADALTAAHAVGIVHRDLKPGNIMVDTHGRVKVLDFGLAKLTAPGTRVAGADEATRTLIAARPLTEEGVVLGSVPYMSPEQAEGKPVDARSDIFSFGALLYEMVTGQRAFRGESRASTLAAVVEQEPQPTGEIAPSTPPELERLIVRCLRKDVSRRSQHMADLKLALEELLDESESGKLVCSKAASQAPVGGRRRIWPAVTIASVLVAAAALAVTYVNRRGGLPAQGLELVRLSPEDDYSYWSASLSPDGKFVAWLSDRSGSPQVWLQQAAGGEQIQLTHSANPVQNVRFLPDGTTLFYRTRSAEGRVSIELVPILGGQPRVLMAGWLGGGVPSPDGRQIAYFEFQSSQPQVRLMILPIDSSPPRELPNLVHLKPAESLAWTNDSSYLLCVGAKRAEAVNSDEWEWFALPVDGGSPRPTGAGDVLRAAGLQLTGPDLVAGDRVLFHGSMGGRENVWEIRFSPDSWRVRGAPRRLTFGTDDQRPTNISAAGMVTVETSKSSTDLYFIPLASTSGQPTGLLRRLTHDGRMKYLWKAGGEPGSAYFFVRGRGRETADGYSLDLESGKQALIAEFPNAASVSVSPDGQQIAYSIPEGDSYSIRVGYAGGRATAARLLCKGCGAAQNFSADGRFLLYQPEAKVKLDPRRKTTIRLLEVASGKDKPWLEHSTGSVFGAGPFGEKAAWVTFSAAPFGSQMARRYIVPWSEEPIPPSEWIELKLPSDSNRYAPYSNFLQFFQGAKLMAIRFDPKTRTFSEPYEVKYTPGSETPKPSDDWDIRGLGSVFSRGATTKSVWLMKLPE